MQLPACFEVAGKIMNRMIELKGWSADVMKLSPAQWTTPTTTASSSAICSSNSSIWEPSSSTGSVCSQPPRPLVAERTRCPTTLNQNLALGQHGDRIVSSEGNSGPKVSVNKSLLFSALTIAHKTKSLKRPCFPQWHP